MTMKASCAMNSTAGCFCYSPQKFANFKRSRAGIQDQQLRQLRAYESLFGGRNQKLKATGSQAIRKRHGVVRAVCESSYIMVKPDGVQRGLVGKVIARFEDKGFKLKGLKMFKASRDLAEEHYAELKDRPFFPDLVEYILSGPVVCMVSRGVWH